MLNSIIDTVAVMRKEDYADIILVAVIIYNVIMLVRGTRSGQVLLGLALLVLTYLLAGYFQLLTLSFLMSNLMTNIFTVLVILFAVDIRRGLARMGRFSFSKTSPVVFDAVNEVVRAAFFMAENRIGALIAFERHVSLGEYIEAGAKLGSVVSDRLLLAIFNTHAPLHDGAVIIREGRLAAAGCFLPLLPSEDNVAKFFGTRHRAAIGLSRESDSLIVVVSEERGLVSLVRNGEVEVMMGAASLRDRLLSNMGMKVKKDKTGSSPAKGVVKKS
ncbi:MAG: diadenylate cyclase CdaA [Deltaproteobacteria bacterium]|jgi:diadenylate cyclase|nr:diadenylate cyclase CdaA [Deltaproteobacteria bacterium]